MKHRRRSKGAEEESTASSCSDVQAILDALKEVAVDRHWVRYDEAKKCQDAKVQVDRINNEQSHKLLSALHKLTPKLVFVRSAIKESISKLYDSNGGWGMQEDLKEQYVDIMARRTINLCRVVGQAITHKHPPAWIQHLPFVSGRNAAEPVPATRSDAFVWVYTFDRTTRQAFRTNAANNSSSKPEAAVDLLVDPKKQYPVAKFADGSQAEITDILCSDLTSASSSSHAPAPGAAIPIPPRRQKKRKAAVLNSNVLFSERHKVSSNLIQVKVRIDRKMLISIYDGGRQVCQLPLHSSSSDPAADEADLRKSFMVELAGKYTNNEIDRDGLFSARNEKFPSCSARVGILRKPAAAPTASAMPAAATPAPRGPRVQFAATADEETDVEDTLSNGIEADFSSSVARRSESPDDVPSSPGLFSMGCGMDYATSIDVPVDPNAE